MNTAIAYNNPISTVLALLLPITMEYQSKEVFGKAHLYLFGYSRSHDAARHSTAL